MPVPTDARASSRLVTSRVQRAQDDDDRRARKRTRALLRAGQRWLALRMPTRCNAHDGVRRVGSRDRGGEWRGRDGEIVVCRPVGPGPWPGTLALLYRIEMICVHEIFVVPYSIRDRMMEKPDGALCLSF